jgi:cytochrome c peroxidase
MQFERSRPRRRTRAGLGLGLLLLSLSGGAPAQTPVPDSTVPSEPITPIPRPVAADPLKIALGERLFEDPRLSHDDSHSCASCHDVHTNGATGTRHDRGADGADLPLNTNTVFNAALSFRVGWAGQFKTLEDQAEASLSDPTFMATTIDEVLGKLKTDPVLTHQFAAAYGHGPERTSLLDAIATYERSLVTPDSRFDRWLEGDATALSPLEQSGYALFKSLGCVSCHQGVNAGGNLFERHGIFHPLASPTPEILRVPSLRNIATSPPYFHDGSAATLGIAVRRMGFAQLNETLSDSQIEEIVSFLQTLTGTYRGEPVTTPEPAP